MSRVVMGVGARQQIRDAWPAALPRFLRQGVSARRPRGLKRASLLAFLEELADLLEAALPLDEALRVISETATDPMLKTKALSIRDGLTRGRRLSEALGDAGFPTLVGATLRAGEESGALVEVLRQLAEGLTQDQQFRAEVRKAMAYPMVVLSILVGVMGLYFSYVLPKLAQLLPQEQLPGATRVLLGLVRGLRTGWPLLLLGGAGLGWGAWRVLHSEARYGLPLLGPLLQHLALARLFAPLALLLRTGLVLDRALAVTEEAVADPGLPTRVRRLSARLQRGVSLSEAMKLDPLFPPLSAQLVAIGERTGRLHDYLGKLHNLSRRQVERRLKLLTAALGPLLLVAVAGVVLILFFGFVLPIYKGMGQLRGL